MPHWTPCTDPKSELDEQPEWEPPTRVEADGEVFDVAAGRDRVSINWASRPNPGYGFAVGTSDGRKISSADIVDAIRDFLAGVDPEMGYIE
jgi:hypothetical protein